MAHYRGSDSKLTNDLYYVTNTENFYVGNLITDNSSKTSLSNRSSIPEQYIEENSYLIIS